MARLTRVHLPTKRDKFSKRTSTNSRGSEWKIVVATRTWLWRSVKRAENRERSSWNRGSSRGMPRALPLSCHCSATVQRFIHNLTCYPRIQLWPRGHMQSAAARRGKPLIMEMISSYVPGQVVRPIRARFGGR